MRFNEDHARAHSANAALPDTFFPPDAPVIPTFRLVSLNMRQRFLIPAFYPLPSVSFNVRQFGRFFCARFFLEACR